MRRAFREYLPGSLVLLLLLGFLAPSDPAVAQEAPAEQTCPDGLVYDAAGDICVLPEDTPGDEPDDTGEQPVDEPVEEEQLPTEAPVVEEPPAEEPVEEQLPADDTQQLMEEPEQAPAETAAQIRNLTLLTFSCPINWNPATRPIESSREMCTEPIVANMTYTVLFEGEELVSATFGVPIDLAETFGASGPGMYTIRETVQEGLEDPFAFCAIYAADGTSRLTVAETVPGGSLDILLAAGEEVNCEWYSVATVPDVAAAPALGLDLRLFSCPAPAEFNGGLDECTLPHPGPISFAFSYGGQVVETGTVSPPEFTYDLDKDDPLSGEWTIRPILPEGWIDPHFTCTNGDITSGASISDATFFPPADGSLGVTVQLNPDQRVQCQVWLFAGDVRESVVVVTRDCPEDYDAATLPPGVRKATCPGSQFFPVSITVDDAAPVEGESTRNGVAVFPTQPGTWRITVDPERGVGGRAVTFVTCDHTIAALGQVQTIEPTINTDQRSVSIALDEGDALRCDFFFGPAPAAAEQPPAAEESSGTESGDPAGETSDTGETDAGTGDDAPTDAGDTFGGGDEGTEDDAGTDETTTQPEDGGADSGSTGDEGATTDQPAAEGEDSGETDEPATDSATSELSIQHYDCDSPVADATVDDLVANCTASVAPSSWTLNGEPLDVGDGYAIWDGLEPNTMTVSNAAAGGNDDTASAVYCSIAPTGGEPLVAVEVPVKDGAIEVGFDQPAVVYCAWFLGP